MLCPKCGITVDEDRETCPTCGERIYPAPSFYQSSPDEANPYKSLLQRKMKEHRAHNRKIGIILIVIGIIFIPIAIFNFTEAMGWIFWITAGICLLIGVLF